MMTDKKIEILNHISSTKKSGWYELAKWRQSNASWLDKSAHIALKVLMKLRESGITKKEFAEAMNVSPQYISKLLKGHENMSLETICKMENILKITLIDIPFEFQTTTNSTCKKL
jgi:DNA-binding XRE family transcriptional regulator